MSQVNIKEVNKAIVYVGPSHRMVLVRHGISFIAVEHYIKRYSGKTRYSEEEVEYLIERNEDRNVFINVDEAPVIKVKFTFGCYSEIKEFRLGMTETDINNEYIYWRNRYINSTEQKVEVLS